MWRAAPATFTKDIQYRFGALHYAYLSVVRYPVTCAPLPCRRLSRPPWWVVTPTTTTGTPSPWGSRPVGDPRVRPRRTSERDVGAPLICFNALTGHRFCTPKVALALLQCQRRVRRRRQVPCRRTVLCVV